VLTQANILEWVRSARAGEEAAWNILYKKHYPGAWAVALSICGNTPFAKDAVQDAFVIAYLKLHQLKDLSAFGSWLNKIVTHNCYRALSRENVKKKVDMLPVQPDTWWEDQVNSRFEQLSAQSRIYAAMVQLPESLRITLFLRYFSGYQSYEDIANILCVPIGTVRSRLNQAKLKMAEHWQQNREADESIFRESEEWNHFYYSAYYSIHDHDHYKNKFVEHLHKNIRITVANDQSSTGRNIFEGIIEADRKVGSRLEPIQVLTCGHLSVVEVRHFNSNEHPDHCPPGSISVLYRDKGKVDRMNLYMATK